MKTLSLELSKELQELCNEKNIKMPERSLWGFVSKHIVTVRKMIDEDDSSGPSHTLEEYEDKVMDIYNYMPLLLAIIAERDGRK